VRAGDLYATRLLLGKICLHSARELKHLIERGRAGAQWDYVGHIFVGMYHSMRFGIDRRRRLYVARSL